MVRVSRLPLVGLGGHPEVTLGKLATELRRTMPALDTKVIRTGEERLESYYCFNVNGCFHLDDYDAKVKAADHILIVTFALGAETGGQARESGSLAAAVSSLT